MEKRELRFLPDRMSQLDYEWAYEEVSKILAASPRIKRETLNRGLLTVCVVHMRVDTEEEARTVASRLPYHLTCRPYGLTMADLEALPSETSENLMVYWRYCRRLGFI